MISSLFRSARERRWNRDRRQRIAVMRERERAGSAAVLDCVEEMAVQLAEIWTLPEAPDPSR
ncbi:MAG: hypothetical protein JO325_05165 [Solirubrobacterales bacterium]|nr:hypothetical protein [Solirubrobacterales bacterium]